MKTKKRGKPLTTGRFDTRKKLVEHILYLWKQTSCNQSTIAKNVEVSETTVANIIKNRK